ncbi:hypothetical protein M436DRAFT_35414 [Aureobasidium namibiae CBS 147.97]|uniref:F-box domain-containing protein n=1 Tax=Aureobasidium namibiae CBS 147.97 TaxID=1043004 RepID=A0A074XS24_9PEZI
MPDLDDFPNELLVEFFSYFDLKTLTRCMRVSKLFKAITDHPTFDKIFFRTKITEPKDPINPDKIQINPIFSMIQYTSRQRIKSAHFLILDEKPNGKPKHRKLALIDSSAAKQNATEPAVTCLQVSPYSGASVGIKLGRAVTVRDVMEGLCNYYNMVLVANARHFLEDFYKIKGWTEDELVLKARWSL